MHALKH